MASQEKGMIFLDVGHPILNDTLAERLQKDAKPEPVDITCADFDDVKYQIVSGAETKGALSLRVAMPCYKTIAPMGAQQVVDGPLYGAYKSSDRATGYDLVFSLDRAALRESPEQVAANFSEIKRNLMAAPFRRCFEALAAGKGGGVKPMVIPFRARERIVLAPSSDRVMVFFALHFADETDRAIAKVFLQELTEAQRKIPQAPAATFTRDVPGDLAKVKEFKATPDLVGFVMFQVFKAHVDGKEKMEKAITHFVGFRNYLHYHIKASKSHLHARMRLRVDLLLKVLRRSDPRQADENVGKKAFRTYS